MNGMVGYNPEIAKKAEECIWNYGGYCCNSFCSVSDKMVSGLMKSWYAPESKSIVQSFIDSFMDLRSDSVNRIGSDSFPGGILEKVRSACKKWAETVGETYQIKYSGTSPNKFFMGDASAWMKDSSEDGFRGIISQGIDDVLSELKNFRAEFTERTQQTVAELKSYDFLFGADQLQNFMLIIDSNLKIVQSKLEEIMETISKSAEETKEKYMQTAQANAQTFASGN